MHQSRRNGRWWRVRRPLLFAILGAAIAVLGAISAYLSEGVLAVLASAQTVLGMLMVAMGTISWRAQVDDE